LAETTALQALFANESGGKNVDNTHEGTSSGQAQGYFQITTGTWDEFGGQATGYAVPHDAPYAVQAAIASRIPLSRWDSSTIDRMRATGRAIDPRQTLGQNLAMNGESINDYNPGSGVYAKGGAPKPTGGAPIAVAQTQTSQPPNMGSMLGQALAQASGGGMGMGSGSNNVGLAMSAPPGPGPQMAFRAAQEDAAQAPQMTAGGPPGSGAPGTGPAGMSGLLGLMQDPTATTPLALPTDMPMTGMSGLLYGGGAALGVRRPAVTRLA
jgi:hypothetical protein